MDSSQKDNLSLFPKCWKQLLLAAALLKNSSDKDGLILSGNNKLVPTLKKSLTDLFYWNNIEIFLIKLSSQQKTDKFHQHLHAKLGKEESCKSPFVFFTSSTGSYAECEPEIQSMTVIRKFLKY